MNRLDRYGERLSFWLWGTLIAAVVVVVVVMLASASDDDSAQIDPLQNQLATLVERLGQQGSPDGEGLSPATLTAPPGISGTRDGGSQVPTATIDGPGRRLFAGVTVRVPGGKTGFELRQILPGDLPAARGEGAFVRWSGYVAIVPRKPGRRGRLAATLTWAKADNTGVTVPPSATVRLRTMFRIPASAGRCSGRVSPNDRLGNRATEVLRRAPAWMIRRKGEKGPWSWLRIEGDDLNGVARAVRSGPTRAVTFRGSQVCATPQGSVTVNPDPEQLQVGGEESGLPLEPPDAY